MAGSSGGGWPFAAMAAFAFLVPLASGAAAAWLAGSHPARQLAAVIAGGVIGAAAVRPLVRRLARRLPNGDSPI